MVAINRNLTIRELTEKRLIMCSMCTAGGLLNWMHWHTYVRTALNHTKYMQLRIDTTHNHTMALKRICEGDIGHCVSLNRIVMSLACNYCPNLDPKTPSGLERNTKKSVESKSLISGYCVHLLQLKDSIK
eukprot:316546_1